MAAAVAGNMWLAYRNRPVYPAVSPEQQNLERYRQGVEPFRKIVFIGLPALFGLLAGSSAASEWKTFLLWRNGEPFGIDDPQFGRDLSFFVFDYPWLRFLLSFMFGLLVLSLLVSVVAHYLYGGIRLQTPGDRTTRAARIQIAVLLGLFVLLKAAAYWLDRYGLAVKEGELIAGLTYTDVNAVLPAKTILVFIALICAVLFFAQRVPARLAVAAGRARAPGRQRDHHRRRLPGDRAAVPGAAERGQPRGAVHPAQHRRDPRKLRHRRRRRAGIHSRDRRQCRSAARRR